MHLNTWMGEELMDENAHADSFRKKRIAAVDELATLSESLSAMSKVLPRGALALVGKSLDVCRKSLAQYSPT